MGSYLNLYLSGMGPNSTRVFPYFGKFLQSNIMLAAKHPARQLLPERHGRQPAPTKAAARESSAPVQRVHSAVASHAHLRQPGAAAQQTLAKAAPRSMQRPAAARRAPATLLGDNNQRRSVSAHSASEFSTRSQGLPATRVARGLENSPRATGDVQPWSSSPSPSWQPAAARREGYLAKRAALAAGEWLTAPAAPPIVWAPARPRSAAPSWPEEAGLFRASRSEGAEAVQHLTQENDDLYREVERLELRVLELGRRGDGQQSPSGCSPGACARLDTPAGPASAGTAAAAPASAVDALTVLQAELRQMRGEQQALTARCEELSSEREAMEASLRAARGETADTAAERVRELELELSSERSVWRQKGEAWEKEASRLRKGGGGGEGGSGDGGQVEARRAQAEAEELRREMHRSKEEVQELRRQLQATGGTGAKGAADTAAAAAAAAQARRAEEEVRRAQAEADDLRREMQRGKEETQRSKDEVQELRRQLQATGGTKGVADTAAAAGRAEEEARRAQAEAGELRREAEWSKGRVQELEEELADSKLREEESSKLAEEWKAYADSLENQDEEGEEEGEEESGEESGEEEPAKGQR